VECASGEILHLEMKIS